MDKLLLLPIVLPILAGLIILNIPVKVIKTRKNLIAIVLFSMVVSIISSTVVIAGFIPESCRLFELVDNIYVYFQIDEISRIFASLTTCALFMIGIFSIGYLEMHHGEVIEQTEETIRKEKAYHAFYLMVYGVLMGLDFSGNLITFYLFYELMTLTSAPLVFYERTKESIMAGMKYMFYSFAGAYMALFGIYFFNKYVGTINFTPGGVMNLSLIEASGKTNNILILVFLMIIGFGVKAGLFPLHAWLPAAHPVAPAPASAALSGIIVKSGVLAIIRVVYFIVGPEIVRGTWVQTTWIILAMVTIIMGSTLAFKSKLLKKRFAYSTVSNLSYILLGLAYLNPLAFTGAVLHVIIHAMIKGCLFMSAGYIIAQTGKTYINELHGLGKKMPALFTCYIIGALGLIGIPPTSGLVSKWYLGIGALDSAIPVFSWLGPVVLLISALLTAGYLIPIATNAFMERETQKDAQEKIMAFFQKEEKHYPSNIKTNYWMLIPIIIFAVGVLLAGIFPDILIQIISGISSEIM